MLRLICVISKSIFTFANISLSPILPQTPEISYIGSDILFNTTTASRTACQSFCDAFLDCESILYIDGNQTTTNNCQILGGDVESVDEEVGTEVEVARGTTAFTVALSDTTSFAADAGAWLGEIQNIFDLDECQSLCESHVSTQPASFCQTPIGDMFSPNLSSLSLSLLCQARCGSLTFGARTCSLYDATGFAAGVEAAANNQATPYYTSFETFISVDRSFAEATGLCVEDQDYGE